MADTNRSRWLSKITPSGPPGVKKLEKTIQNKYHRWKSDIGWPHNGYREVQSHKQDRQVANRGSHVGAAEIHLILFNKAMEVYNEIYDDRSDLNKRQWSKKRGMFQQLKNKRS